VSLQDRLMNKITLNRGSMEENINFTDAERTAMNLALELAGKARERGDVPIGAVILYDGLKPDSPMGRLCREKGIFPGEILGTGFNQRNFHGNALCHAEILAIEEACKKIGDWRLEDCTLYVNLEPCPMCAGAILQARIPRLQMSVRNPKAGFCGSVMNILQMKELNHRVEITEGLQAEEAKALLQDFFVKLRLKEG